MVFFSVLALTDAKQLVIPSALIAADCPRAADLGRIFPAYVGSAL